MPVLTYDNVLTPRVYYQNDFGAEPLMYSLDVPIFSYTMYAETTERYECPGRFMYRYISLETTESGYNAIAQKMTAHKLIYIQYPFDGSGNNLSPTDSGFIPSHSSDGEKLNDTFIGPFFGMEADVTSTFAQDDRYSLKIHDAIGELSQKTVNITEFVDALADKTYGGLGLALIKEALPNVPNSFIKFVSNSASAPIVGEASGTFTCTNALQYLYSADGCEFEFAVLRDTSVTGSPYKLTFCPPSHINGGGAISIKKNVITDARMSDSNTRTGVSAQLGTFGEEEAFYGVNRNNVLTVCENGFSALFGWNGARVASNFWGDGSRYSYPNFSSGWVQAVDQYAKVGSANVNALKSSLAYLFFAPVCVYSYADDDEYRTAYLLRAEVSQGGITYDFGDETEISFYTSTQDISAMSTRIDNTNSSVSEVRNTATQAKQLADSLQDELDEFEIATSSRFVTLKTEIEAEDGVLGVLIQKNSSKISDLEGDTESIRSEVSTKFEAIPGQINIALSNSITNLQGNLEGYVNDKTDGIEAKVDDVTGDVIGVKQEIDTHFSFTNDGLKIYGTVGAAQNDSQYVQITASEQRFVQNNETVLLLNSSGVNGNNFIASGDVKGKTMTIAPWQWFVDSNGVLTLGRNS